MQMANKRQKKAKPNDRLNYGDVSRELKAGGPARLYLLYGQEDYLREAFLGEIKAACLPDGGDDFSYHRLDGRSTSLRELSDAVNALPFLSERTLTEVRGYDFAHCRDAEAAALEKLISDIPDWCTLAFVQDTDFEPDQRTKIMKAVAKYGKVINFTSQGQGPLVQWIRKRFAALGKNALPDACVTLLYLSGELMNGLIPEIEKIAAGTQGELVTAEDVSRLAMRIPEARVFEMTDQLAARDYDGACRTLADLMAMGEEPIAILAVIGTQMRRLYAARVAVDEKLGSDFVRQYCGVKFDFMVDRLLRSARGFDTEDLARAVELCAETDYAMKSTGMDGADLLSELLIKIAAGRGHDTCKGSNRRRGPLRQEHPLADLRRRDSRDGGFRRVQRQGKTRAAPTPRRGARDSSAHGQRRRGLCHTQFFKGRHRPRAREAGLYPRHRGQGAAKGVALQGGQARRRGYERRDADRRAAPRGSHAGGRGAHPPERRHNQGHAL